MCWKLNQLADYFGIMQAVMVKFAWVFYTLMGVSGVEAVVAVASPFIGQVGRSNYHNLCFSVLTHPTFSFKNPNKPIVDRLINRGRV
jgi:nucleoside permease NupC